MVDTAMRIFKILMFVFLLVGIPLTLRASDATNYKDYVICSNEIWALTTHGQIRIFNSSDGSKSDQTISYPLEIIALAKDRFECPVIADKEHFIKRYNLTKKTWEPIVQCTDSIYGILFDALNHCYVISDMGIEDLAGKAIYKPDEGKNDYTSRSFWVGDRPYAYYMDRNDNIWAGYGYGEDGGTLVIFSCSEKKIIAPDLKQPNCYIENPFSFFEDSSGVYLSNGFGLYSVFSILKFEQYTAHCIIISEDRFKCIPIGAGAYNCYNHCIYFYSHDGFFKGDVHKDLSKIENWDNILKPDVLRTKGQNHLVGAGMNVLKISILDANKFIFLTERDGFGYYDGKTLKMIR